MGGKRKSIENFDVKSHKILRIEHRILNDKAQAESLLLI